MGYEAQAHRAEERNPGSRHPLPGYRPGMKSSEIRWNDEARAKILDDADRVLREAVVDLAGSGEMTSDEAFAALTGKLKDKFIDWEPGPDLRTYADAIANGEVETDAE